MATVAGVGATIMTGGLAAPLIGWGIAGSVAGAVTRSVSEGIGQHLSKTKMEKAQKIMDEEAKHSKEIEEKKAELDKTVERLGKLLKLDRDQVLGMLFMANLLADMGILPNRLAADTAKLFLYSGSTVFLISGIALETMGQEMTKLIMKVSVQNILEIVGAVLQGMALGAAAVVLAWEIYQWVNVTADLVKGTSEAAEALEKVADELEKQMKEIEDWLNKLQ